MQVAGGLGPGAAGGMGGMGVPPGGAPGGEMDAWNGWAQNMARWAVAQVGNQLGTLPANLQIFMEHEMGPGGHGPAPLSARLRCARARTCVRVRVRV